MRLKLVAVAVAALAPVVAMLVYNEVALRHQRNEEVRASAAQAARQASSEVERIIEGLHALLVAVSAMPSVRHLDVQACNDALKSVVESIPNIRTIFVAGLDGHPICGSMAFPQGVMFSDRDYFRQTLETKDFVVGTYTQSRLSDRPVLPLAMPLMEGDTIKAIVISGIRLDWLQNRITERGIAPGNAVTIADAKGVIIAHVPSPEQFVGTILVEEYQRLIHAEQPDVIETTGRDGTARILGYRPIALPSNPLYVSAGFSKTEVFAPIDRATLMNTLAIIGGALFAFVAAIFIGNRFILIPISRIADVMESWRSGQTTARTGMTGPDELGLVGATFDRLLDELEERRRQNQQAEEERSLLVRELAHRVKNGFTLVQAIARQTFSRSDPERYGSFAERLAALAGTYDLILSREGSASPIRDILSAALRAHVASQAERIHLDGPDVVLPADTALPLSLVIHELATNATKYGSLGSENGTVSIEWKHEDGRVLLLWTEAGGPPVSTPTKKGFGSVLIERAFPSKAQARSRADYRSEGLVFQLIFSIAEPVAKGEVDPLSPDVKHTSQT
ncbi:MULTISPECIES: HWE histidine kinase domain-containing protein [Rhizobium]|uniref:sensor histidine kinase n=1 Tax=Rhizobium TaxID=379 RepID=UPI001B3416A4|nr:MULTISPECIES: HWE histidine kinase domain-containing protein [Rhizobium]MBX4908860.1 HAMP domain-containing protein [Rhizobium bangladeshense]MBX5215995.1 HAMP domain-containing protein [Rhizobium sp. NLR9a]MBX5234372.1 HAMP domain-containing protein [Rhizobium sp. NLR4a]MBX5246693.1 HAMP domain-containing protein [Rhizobium sp. NLR3b]MBX5251374.1 HAMP domain-containing protein [Rhizobium sp. NLR4b]